MSSGPINTNLTTGVTPQVNRNSVKPPAAEAPEATPQDMVQVGTTPAQAQPVADDTSVITMRVKVKNSLLEPDAEGKSKLDDLEPDFVPKGTASSNAPTFITALADPGQVPEGFTPVSTVALVPSEQAKDLDALNRDYFAAFVPQGGYAVSQQQIDEYGKEHEQAGFQKGLSEGIEKGAKNALPPGYQAKLMDSEAGLKIEAKRDQFSSLLGTIGSTSGALGISAGIGIPAHYAAPLALAAAPLQIFGPAGTLSTMAKLEHQKAALVESVKAENPDKDPMKVAVDMNPHTQMPISTEEAIHNIDVLKKAQKMKTVGSALLIGAGVAALGGWGTAATALAIGSMATPLADTLPTFDKIGQVRERKKDLNAQLEARIQEGVASGLTQEDAEVKARASTVEAQVPILNEAGQPVGFEAKQIALSEALDHVGKQQKLLALGAVGAVAQAGSLVAMGLGCPIMMVVGASVAIPLLARGALFPSETWQTLKALPGKIWDGIKAVGQAIGRKLGLVKGPKGGDEAGPMSNTQKALFKTMADIGDADPKLAEGLKNTLEALHRPPTNEAEQKAAIAAGKDHEAQLAQLKAEHPELAARFESNMKDLIAEGAQQAEEAQMEAMHDQVENVVSSKFGQSLLQTPGVQSALKSVGGDHQYGESVLRMMAQAQVFQDGELYQDLLRNEATDKDAANMLQVYRALEVEVGRQQPNQPAA
ncbi:MAG: hypothetical protein J0I12_35500 [Candidatus Eremiobacteraeota bacterium]|nr:hypothetical protein [Candidatus Eremiobacteraeota bacterium]